ncbi:MAG: HEAT repeat domain-containing protein, partial [Promethearchaeota archaeon]
MNSEEPSYIGELKAARDIDGLREVLVVYEDSFHIAGAAFRRAAAKALGELGTREAMAPLIDYLKYYDGSEDVLECVVEALGMIEGGVDAAVDELLKYLTWDASDNEVTRRGYDDEVTRCGFEEERHEAVKAFRALGSPAVRATFKAVRDGADVISAGYILGAADREDVELLLEEFKDPEGRAPKGILAEVFGFIGDTRATELLIRVLRETPSVDKRELAARALGQIGDARGVEPLIDALQQDDPSVQTSAIFALGHIGDTRAMEALIDALSHEPTQGSYDWRSNYVSLVAGALGYIRDIRVVKALIQGMQKSKNEYHRRAFVNALVKIGEMATESLVQVIQIGKGTAVADAIRALMLIGKPSVEPLIEGLQHAETTDTKIRIVNALGEIGDKRAVE